MFRKTLLILLIMTAWLMANGQKVDIKQLEGLKARSIGPAGMSGRVTTIDVNLQNSDEIYVGTASGGVWKSQSGGINWTPIFDDQPVQSIGALAINQQNPSEIWVGTGEGNPRNSLNTGEGIFKSLDGGKTWTRMGLEKTKVIHRIIIHPQNSQIVYAAAMGSPWGPNPERGVYKTTDGGKTWKKILYNNDLTGCADLVVDPSNPNKLIAAMWEHERKPWFFNSGGKGSGLYITYDGGNNWKKITAKEGLPEGDLGRIGLAIAPSKPNTVYALVEAKVNGFYRSTDGGETWKLRSTDDNIGNRPFYYSDIFVDSKNENRVWSLHSLVTKTEDGGKDWEVVLPYSGMRGVHPDHHAFWIHPDNPNYLIEGNDGGLNISRDGGDNWQFIANLPVGQFYHVSVDMDYPYNIYGGMQDNGSWIGPSSVWKRGGIHNSDWRELYFGDGFDVIAKPSDSRYVYAMSQGGNVAYIDRETGDQTFIKPYHPEGKPLRFNWNAAIAQNPYEDCGIYFGSQYVHKSMDCGNTWTIISPDLTTNDTTKQQQEKTGGLTIDNTRAENHTTILAIAPSPVEKEVIWVGTDDGNLQITQDGGDNWKNVASNLPGFPQGAWIPQIEVSKTNAAEAFIVVNDYRRNNWKPMLYHTSDYGKTFRRLVDGRQVNGHVLSIVQDPLASNLLFLGTDYGLYVSFDKGQNWNKWMNDYPSVPTMDLKIHPREHDLVIGTFGRAFYVLDDIRPLREIAKTNGKVLDKKFKVFNAPDAYLAQYRSVDGSRFIANAHFTGENRKSGAMLSLWVNPDTTGQKAMLKNMDKEKSKEKATIEVFDETGDLIRTFTSKLDTGINRIYWDLEERGVRFPSYRKVKKDADEPSGNNVLPGIYKLKYSYKGYVDSNTVHVKADPRLPVNIEDLQANRAALKDYYQLIEKATEGFNRLVEAKETIGLVGKSLENTPDSTQQQIKDMGKDLSEEIARLQKLYTMPPDTKGIQRTADNLNEHLYTAIRYIYTSKGKPNQNAIAATAKAEEKTAEVLKQINDFFGDDWKAFQNKVQQAKMSLFKDYEPIE